MMLLITSIFFFGMAQSIEINSTPAPKTFYYIMGLMLSSSIVRCSLSTALRVIYRHDWTITELPWIGINLILGVICSYASSAVPNPHPDGPANGLEWFVLIAATLRSVIDYAVSIGFMFPHTEDTKPTGPLDPTGPLGPTG